MKTLRRLGSTFAALTAMALSVSTAHAQFASEIRNLARQDNRWTFDLLFRNTQLSAPIGTNNPIWSITGVGISIPTMLAKCGTACEISAFDRRFVGAVDTRRLDVQGAQWISTGTAGWSGDEFCAVRCSTLPIVADPINAGILGCQLPVTSPTSTWFYTARTCDEEGFAGWMAWTVFVDFGAPVSDFSVDQIILTPRIQQIGTVTASVVPEPAIGHLLMAGFALIAMTHGLRQRRRTRAD